MCEDLLHQPRPKLTTLSLVKFALEEKLTSCHGDPIMDRVGILLNDFLQYIFQQQGK
jgi:hypothetical protein